MNTNRICFLRFAVRIVAGVFFLISSVSAQPWLQYDAQFTGVPQNQVQINVQMLSRGHYILSLSQPQLRTDEFDYNQTHWSYITIDGETRLWQEGKPVLPAINRSVRLEDRGGVSVKILATKYHEYHVSTLFPQQPIPIEGADPANATPFVLDKAVYSEDSWFPNDIAKIGNASILRDARIGLLSVHPVQYNPVQNTLRVYDSIELEILPNNEIGENELNSIHRPVPSFAPFYRDIIGAEDLVEESNSATPGQILLITRNDTSIINTLKPWIDWKTSSGRKVQLVTTAASTTPDIQSIVTSAYASSNPPLESVVLVGEGGTSGSFYMPTVYTYFAWGGGAECYGDHPYYMLAGGDPLADVNYARFSCTDLQTLRTIVARTILYEKNPYIADTTWFTRGWGYAGYMGNYQTTSIRPAIRYCNTMMYQRGVTDTLYDEHIGNVSPTLICTRMNPGAIFWAHRSANGADMHPSDIVNLLNTNRPYIAFHISCQQGHWYGSSNTGVNEAETRLGSPSQPLGAIASMAPDDPTGVTYNNCLACGCYYGLGVLNVRTASSLYLTGKYFMWRNFQDNTPGQVQQNSYENNQMGDATVNFWTGVPQIVTATIPSTISPSVDHLDFTLSGNNVAGALVTAWKRDSLGNTETYYSTTSDSFGFTRLLLSNQTPGYMIITVTGNRVGQNLYPLIDTISIQSTPIEIGCTIQSITDDTTGGRVGNNDHFANPGETFDLALHLSNRGSGAAQNITLSTFSLDSRLQILQTNFAAIDSLTQGDTIHGFGTVRIQLSGNITNNTSLLIGISANIGTPTQTCTLYVSLPVLSLQSTFISYALYNGGGSASTFNPGSPVWMTMTVKNLGAAADTTTITLHSRSYFVSMTDSVVTIPSFVSQQQVTTPSTHKFIMSSTSDIVPGTPAQLYAVLHSRSMYDTVYFSVPVGTETTTDPTGPDAYGYYAYEDLDTSYSRAQPYNWYEIIPTSGGQGTRLPLYDSANNHDQNTLVALPFPVRYYGAVYDSITVCSNGWIAFGCQPIFNNLRNWHLPACEGPRNLVAVFWFDLIFTEPYEGVFTMYDSTLHAMIITWRARLEVNSAPVEVQLVIYDEQYRPTPTHDAELLFQYKAFSNFPARVYDVDYCTIGIADSNYQRALEITYWNTYTPGSTPIINSGNVQRNILFSTWSRYSSVPNVQASVPLQYGVVRTYPNPFNAFSRIVYNLPEPQRVSVAIFNVNGQQVTRLLDNTLQSGGRHYLNFDGSKLPAGIYFCRVTTDSKIMTTKLTLLK